MPSDPTVPTVPTVPLTQHIQHEDYAPVIYTAWRKHGLLRSGEPTLGAIYISLTDYVTPG